MSLKLTQEEIINRCNKKHNYKYDYSQLIHVNLKTIVLIGCSIHGLFEQRMDHHLSGHGCKKCFIEKAKIKYSKSKEQFVIEANIKHFNFYNYDKFIYKNWHTKGIITCPKHGDFLQNPNAHLNGRLTGNGCPVCKSSKGERIIFNYLKNKEYAFTPQKRFTDCRGTRYPLPFDFYLSEYNILIEYHGEQHFKVINGWGGLNKFEKTKINDSIKKQYCISHDISLIEIRYDVKDIIKTLEDAIMSFINVNNKIKKTGEVLSPPVFP